MRAKAQARAPRVRAISRGHGRPDPGQGKDASVRCRIESGRLGSPRSWRAVGVRRTLGRGLPYLGTSQELRWRPVDLRISSSGPNFADQTKSCRVNFPMARINPTLFGRAPKNCNSREKKAHPRVLPRPSLLLSVRTGAFTSEMEVPHSPHWSPLKELTRISDAGATEDECTVHASVELKSTETEIKSHRCPICYQTMLMPKRAPNILMPCGHTFCNACLNARDDPRCRTCGDRWRHRVPNHQLQTTIQAYVDATST